MIARLLSVAGLLALAGCAGAPKSAAPGPPPAAFPDAWIGKWSGPLQINGPAGVLQEVPMSLEIGPAGADGRHAWTIQYEGQPPRPYVLIPDDPAAGAYRIDERNGIVLGAQRLGNALYSSFGSGGMELLCRYEHAGGAIIFEVLTQDAEPAATTGGGDVPEFASYKVTGWQRARLERE